MNISFAEAFSDFYTTIEKKEGRKMSYVLEATDLCKSFSNESVQQHVLKNLNLKIEKGDFVVIMGNSGSGKSTLLYALSGMDRPSLGSIKIDGEEISKYSNDKLALIRRKKCGFVFQQNYLNDTMSVMDNILVSGLLVSKNKKETVSYALEMMKKAGLNENVRGKYPTQLSGGEAQRVALVRSIINKPEILFADEPTGALNSSNTINVLDIFTELNNGGQTIVMVTHDMRAARRANRLFYLSDGVIMDQITLGKYTPHDERRHEQVREFLTKMGW